MAIRKGSKGPEVRAVQERLAALGFLRGQIDGDFGPNTEDAVKRFQASRGLAADGVVGPRTSAELDRANAGTSSPPSPTSPSPTAGARPALVAVERPGGQRIKDKSEPSAGDLTTLNGHNGKQVSVHRLAATAWNALVDAARADGIPAPYLLAVSGYRTVAAQERSWQRALERYGSEAAARQWVAKPGGSPHHSGRAIDCWLGSSINSSNVDEQRLTEAWKWLDRNAIHFGFYPYSKEPWHWEYNPPAQ